jgi:hypothetical protein
MIVGFVAWGGILPLGTALIAIANRPAARPRSSKTPAPD